jgi:hypothetical protein
VTWTNVCGPLFGNTIATVEVDDRSAQVLFEQPGKTDELREAGRVALSTREERRDVSRAGG